MIAVDSSVLLRYVLQDDAVQGRIASRFFEERISREQQGFVSIAVILETIWVLRRGYRLPAQAVGEVVSELANAPQIMLEHRREIEAALASGPDRLADLLIHELGRKAGCTETVTFDRRFAQHEGVRLLGG